MRYVCRVLLAFLGCVPPPLVPIAPPVSAPTPGGQPLNIASIDEEDLAALLRNRSSQVLVVNFWATWCGPCVEELSTLAGASARAPDVRFALVNVDDDGEADALGAFAVRHSIALPLYHLAVGDSASTLRRTVPGWPDLIPVTLVVEPGGNVRHVFSGAVTPGSLLDVVR